MNNNIQLSYIFMVSSLNRCLYKYDINLFNNLNLIID